MRATCAPPPRPVARPHIGGLQLFAPGDPPPLALLCPAEPLETSTAPHSAAGWMFSMQCGQCATQVAEPDRTTHIANNNHGFVCNNEVTDESTLVLAQGLRLT
eukprot:m.215674 g.215674  ORF g.215674 m.215674 type:complete len:103 (+) comp19109_c0_seq1:4324-4632(+)